MESDNLFWYYTIMYFFGILSCLCLLLILMVYLYENSKGKSTPAFELVFYLCIASLINTIAFMLLYIPDNNTKRIDPLLCKTQGSLIFFSELSQYTIATIISIFIFKVKNKDDLTDNLSFLKRLIFLGCSFGIPGLITIIGLLLDMFGQNRNKCWIKKELDGLPVLIECIVIWILILINLVLGCITYLKKFRPYITEEILFRIEFSNKLMMYPIVSFICWLISSLTSYFDYESETFDLFDYISVLNNLSEGFLYATVSMYSLSFRKKLKKIFLKINFLKKRKTEEYNITEIIFESKSEHSSYSFDSTIVEKESGQIKSHNKRKIRNKDFDK